MGLLVVLFLAVGLIVVGARLVTAGNAKHAANLFSPSVIRSWMAIAIAGAVVVLTGASFLVDDPTSRSTLIGAVVATLGSVTAFYFATKQAEQAANAAAAGAVVTVPDMIGKTYQEALVTTGGTNFAVQVSGASTGDIALAVVKDQDPKGGTSAAANSSITLILGT